MTARGIKVALDATVLRHGLRSGTAQYAFHLAEALLQLDAGPELHLLFSGRSCAAADEALERLRRGGAVVLRAPAPWRWSPDGAWWLPLNPPLGRALEQMDVFHLGEFLLPRRVPAACVATVHDLTTFSHPDQHTFLNRAVHARRLRWIQRRADAVIAVSDATRGELASRSAVGAERIAVVPEARGTLGPEVAAPAGKVLARYGLAPGGYILAVGTVEPRKNYERLLEAFAGLPERWGHLSLAIAGGAGWRSSSFQRALERSACRERVRILDFVPAPELPALYAGAAVFAFPSLYEGFGLPLLEAMAAGVPVLTSNLSSMPEVVGDAAVLVDPLSVDAIRAGLLRLLEDQPLRDRLVDAARVRERQFTWRRAAEGTLAVYRQAIARRSAVLDPPGSAR